MKIFFRDFLQYSKQQQFEKYGTKNDEIQSFLFRMLSYYLKVEQVLTISSGENFVLR